MIPVSLNPTAHISSAFFAVLLFAGSGVVSAAEGLWIEAEHFEGIRGFCWPMGKPEMKKTAGHWGLSGPGWAAEWCQGGEIGFLSIATAGDDDKAVVTKTVEVPVDGEYFLWVRYGDWREKTERFQIRIEQAGAVAGEGRFGDRAVVEEDNEMKLYFGWAFGWDKHAMRLKKGAAKISLLTTVKELEPRQVDVMALTTDPDFRPYVKERPARESWRLLESWRGGIPDGLEPLARKKPDFKLPAAWKPRTFRNGDFLYFWNTSLADGSKTWLSNKTDRVKFPYQVADAKTREDFEKLYGGRDDVPIFSDPRIVPTFHGVGAGVFVTDIKTGEVNPNGLAFAQWLDKNPSRQWAMMMNYHPGAPIGEKGIELFQKYRDRFIGSISGESLGYFYPKPEVMTQATAGATSRRKLVESFTPVLLAENAAKYRAVYGKNLDANPYQDVIACLSVGNIAYTPLCADWGARIIGYESASATSSVLPMRWAFMRGAARQHGIQTATYRSCNFGDSSTIFSNQSSFHTPQNFLDNFYSVVSGAGMTWYKFDIWYQYMAGSSVFYHEQGFDEFWEPGGTTAAGIHPVQLSPKGKLVDRFLRTTAREPDRGQPFTPIAFLVDHAHGWEPAPFWPNSFKNIHGHQEKFLFGDHEKMLEEYFWTAYHPIGVESQRPITAINEVNLPGVFGDIFDVIFAYPDPAKWRTIDTYPVVIATGEIELTVAEGKRLASYVEKGGTLVIADTHLTGPGLAELKLPAAGATKEADNYRWLNDPAIHPSPRFRYRPIEAKGVRPIATTDSGDIFCAALDRGQGRIIQLAVPHGMSISRQVVPAVPRLIAHLSRGQMPIEVAGDVEWMINRTANSWLVTLLNPFGQDKPQHGITPTDYRQNRKVRITSRVPFTAARDRLLPDDRLTVKTGSLELIVPAGAVRIIELK